MVVTEEEQASWHCSLFILHWFYLNRPHTEPWLSSWLQWHATQNLSLFYHFPAVAIKNSCKKFVVLPLNLMSDGIQVVFYYLKKYQNVCRNFSKQSCNPHLFIPMLICSKHSYFGERHCVLGLGSKSCFHFGSNSRLAKYSDWMGTKDNQVSY